MLNCGFLIKMSTEYERKLQELETNDKKAAGRLKAHYKEDIKALSEEEHHALLASEIRTGDNHLAIINSLVSLFFSVKQLGYKFLTVDPIYEIEGQPVKNFDLLFVKYENGSAKIILVEVKSSISKFGKEITHFEETKKVYYDNKGVFENLVGEPISDAEFVFAIPSSFKDDLINHLQQNKPNLQEFIIWSVDHFRSKVYEVKQSNNHSVERTNRRVHQNADLDCLFAGQDFKNLNPIEFTPKSHTIKLLIQFYQTLYHKLKQNKKDDENAFKFHFDLIKLLVSDNTATKNLTEDDTVRFSKLIADRGVQYEIFSKITANEYKLRNTNNPYNIKIHLSNIYIKSLIHRKAEQSALEKFNSSNKDKQKTLF